MRKQGQRGEAGVLVVSAIFAIGMVVMVILLGGTWRTEVTFPLVDSVPKGAEISFEEHLTARHWVFGLVQGEQPDVKQSLAKFARSGERVTSITLQTRHTFVDILLTGLTWGIYAPVTMTVRGKIDRVKPTAG